MISTISICKSISKEDIDSSKIKTSGLNKRILAILTLCFSPPDKSLVLVSISK